MTELSFAVARSFPRALRHLNIEPSSGILVDRSQQYQAWKYLISRLIALLLPKAWVTRNGGRFFERFGLKEFRLARSHRPCFLSRAKGRGGKRHMPIYLEPEQDDAEQWAACTLTQMPDDRWRARFTNVPKFVSERYAESESLQTRHKSLLKHARPCNARSISVSALICWWACGPPRDGACMSTHFVCGQHRCLNPRHIGWGTAADNSRHYLRHQRTLRRSSPAAGVWPKPRRALPPTRRLRLDSLSDED